jgi:hypothetical protein
MFVVFGKRWLLYDLQSGYKATLFMNELELDMHTEKLTSTQKAKEKMQEDLAILQQREPLKEEEYIAMLPDEDKDSKQALYNIRKKVDGERAEEITSLKNRIKQMDDEILKADRELQKGYAMTYQNRIKYDFIKSYKIENTYADKN